MIVLESHRLSKTIPLPPPPAASGGGAGG